MNSFFLHTRGWVGQKQVCNFTHFFLNPSLSYNKLKKHLTVVNRFTCFIATKKTDNELVNLAKQVFKRFRKIWNIDFQPVAESWFKRLKTPTITELPKNADRKGSEIYQFLMMGIFRARNLFQKFFLGCLWPLNGFL